VISGFRLGPDGASGHYKIQPDIMTFGKVIGGGMPVGAYAARREIMSRLAPEGPVYQAGTLSGNPVAMAAGLATLNTMESQNGWDRLETLGRLWDRELGAFITARDFSYVRVGSLFWFCFQAPPAPRTAAAIRPEGAAIYARLHADLLARGVYMAPSAYEVGFLSTAQTEEDLTWAARQIREAFDGAIEGPSK